MFDVGDRIIGLELPDTFYKLAELLEQDQFELLLSKNRIKDMHRKQDISLVYLMNDAVESFLVFHNATITGQYKSEYEGGLLAVLDKKEEEYVLVVHQGDSVITLFFEDLLQQNNLSPASFAISIIKLIASSEGCHGFCLGTIYFSGTAG